mmetsp:Transcript_26365/g.40234  ORF Transcript_26365/g.40234 Transcript_26365/m.40234 type:complete len:111 (-) Transcript_26365:58-390(-)
MYKMSINSISNDLSRQKQSVRLNLKDSRQRLNISVSPYDMAALSASKNPYQRGTSSFMAPSRSPKQFRRDHSELGLMDRYNAMNKSLDETYGTEPAKALSAKKRDVNKNT